MSPILKRDIGEHVRQARRLSAVLFNAPASDLPLAREDEDGSRGSGSTSSSTKVDNEAYVSGYRDPRRDAGPPDGIGLGVSLGTGRAESGGWWKSTKAVKGKGKSAVQASAGEPGSPGATWEDHPSDSEHHDEEEHEIQALLRENQGKTALRPVVDGTKRASFQYAEADHPPDTGHKDAWHDLRNLLLEATPSLLLSLVGLVFTGELLEHLARWTVFRRVDELFILVPMVGNLKGNLEMCLSARLGTSANIGELDHRATRRALVNANMFLLALQALLISSLAACMSFVLGWVTFHRIGDDPIPGPLDPIDPGLAVGEQEWRDGYTKPGWKQLAMVLATGMGATASSALILGTFMCSMITFARWIGIDPDNITPPVAACLGDLLTLFILALLGSALVGTMDTPIPIVLVTVLIIAAVWFTRRVMQDTWIKQVARGSWLPLIAAMMISSGTGMVLDTGVNKYRGFALLAISMTGLTGSIGAIHANRLSTSLHTVLHPSRSSASASSGPKLSHPQGMTPLQSIATLYAVAFPCQGLFLAFVHWAGWIDLDLAWAGWLAFASTTALSLTLAHFMTLFFWSRNLDPDSYTLPIHSALVDFVGQIVLMGAYEICIKTGRDVVMHEPPPT